MLLLIVHVLIHIKVASLQIPPTLGAGACQLDEQESGAQSANPGWAGVFIADLTVSVSMRLRLSDRHVLAAVLWTLPPPWGCPRLAHNSCRWMYQCAPWLSGMKKSFFPEDFEGTKSPQNSEKKILRELVS